MKVTLTFDSTHSVLKAESLLKEAEMVFTLDPAPKPLARYCDLVISVEEDAYEGVLLVLTGAGLEPKASFRKSGDEYVEV